MQVVLGSNRGSWSYAIPSETDVLGVQKVLSNSPSLRRKHDIWKGKLHADEWTKIV